VSTRGHTAYGAATEIGRVRELNEDSLLAQPPLFAVADGLGGHQAGEVASSIAVEVLVENAPRHADSKALARAVHAANRAVVEASEQGTGRAGMGTTLTAAIVEGTHVALAHVGDSRAYLLHAGTLERLTEDHSMVADMIRRGTLTEEESRSHPNRSVITRALGTDPNMCADTYDVEAESGDRLLLATDGLTGMLVDSEIAALLESNRDPQVAARALVDAANEAGGQDNISVVVVDIGPGSSGASSGGGATTREGESALRSWLAVLIWLLTAALVVGGITYLTYRYARSQAYLTTEDGYVVVYRGLPGSFAGLSMHWLETETTITADALDPVVAGRLSGTLRVENVSAAEALVEQYRAQADANAPGSSPPSP
jgi:serine/threonine protein phosphatase PrpC